MQLTSEEQAILNGSQGAVMSKALQTVIAFGEAFDAPRLVDIMAPGHLVISVGLKILKPYLALVDELLGAKLKTKYPFTVDPRPDQIKSSWPVSLVAKLLYNGQSEFEEKLLKLGLKDKQAFSCASYLPEVGNMPRRGDIVAWAESSAVVYINSVLGARTHSNSAGIDLLSNIVGKTPLFGLLTDKGRQATWLIDLQTSTLPNAQLLGSAIGLRVMEDVPYIVGLGRFLDGLSDDTKDYLKDLGAAAASNGAVGLYHVENITPEAVEAGRDLLKDGYRIYTIDDAELERVRSCYPKQHNAQPQLCFTGCPHLSLKRLNWWTDQIGQKPVKIKTVLCAAPGVLEKFEKRVPVGVILSSLCPLIYLSNPVFKLPAITNSNKLRTYTTAHFFLDQEILDIIWGGDRWAENSKDA